MGVENQSGYQLQDLWSLGLPVLTDRLREQREFLLMFLNVLLITSIIITILKGGKVRKVERAFIGCIREVASLQITFR